MQIEAESIEPKGASPPYLAMIQAKLMEKTKERIILKLDFKNIACSLLQILLILPSAFRMILLGKN